MRAPRGNANLVGTLLVIGLIVGGYLTYLIVPLYLDNMDVRQELGNTFLQYASKPDEQVRQILIGKLSTFGDHLEMNELNQLEVVPGIEVAAEDITLIRDPDTHTLRIELDYVREVLLPFDKVLEFDFHPFYEGKTAD